LKLTEANPQTSLETVREHIQAEVNRLLLKQTENNQRWFEEKITPELKQVEDDRKAFEVLKKQHEEVLAAQSSIYAALTQLSQTVREIPHFSAEKLGKINLPQRVPLTA
jgi:hypothetical protein